MNSALRYVTALGALLAAGAAPAPGPELAPGGWAAAQPARQEGRQGAPPPSRRPRATVENKAATPLPSESASSREAPLLEEPKLDAERARTQPTVTVPRSGAGPVLRIPLADGVQGGRQAAGDLPPAWSLKRFVGRAQFELLREQGQPVFRLASQASSFALHRDVVVDLAELPVLTWSWKVVRLPVRGDVRDRLTDDQAAQVYLVFPRAPFPRAASDVLGYVWDSQAPVGLRATNREWSNVRVVVLQSGEQRVGRWVREERNVRQDYMEMFKREPPAVGLIAVMTNSDHTGTASEALFGEIEFQRAGAGSTSEPSRVK